MTKRLLGLVLFLGVGSLLVLGAGCPTNPADGEVGVSTSPTPYLSGSDEKNVPVSTTIPEKMGGMIKGEKNSKRYILNSVQECERARITCQAGESFFSDAQGCGCETIKKEGETMCPDIYMPVCGETVVQCIRAPCPPLKETYSNRCEAERAHVTSITNGACPKP
jgi:hypothetical protein